MEATSKKADKKNGRRSGNKFTQMLNQGKQKEQHSQAASQKTPSVEEGYRKPEFKPAPMTASDDFDKVGTVRNINVHDVYTDTQVRTKFREESIAGLGQSMVSGEQESPIIVAPPNEQGKYCIFNGERRWRAAQAAGMETIQAIVRHKLKDMPQDIYVMGQLKDNFQREDLDASDTVRAILKVKDLGRSSVWIAEQMGVSTTFISHCIAVGSRQEQSTIFNEFIGEGLTSDVTMLYHLSHLIDLSEKTFVELAEQFRQGTAPSRNAVIQLKKSLKNPETEKQDAVLKSTDHSVNSKSGDSGGNQAPAEQSSGHDSQSSSSVALTSDTGSGHVETDQPESHQPKEQARRKPSPPKQSLPKTEQINDYEQEDDGAQFDQVMPGAFSIKLMYQGKEGELCLERQPREEGIVCVLFKEQDERGVDDEIIKMLPISDLKFVGITT